MKTTVTASGDNGFIGDQTPVAAEMYALVNDMAPLRPSRPEVFSEIAASGMAISQGIARATTSVGRPIELLLELAGIKAAIRAFYAKDPDQVLRECGAYSARLTEIWTELRLLEATSREYLQMRTMQVQPVLDELDRQLKINSSRIAMLRQDIDMSGKGGGA